MENRFGAVLLFCVAAFGPVPAVSMGQSPASPAAASPLGGTSMLSRKYVAGQTFNYKMTGRNQNGDNVRVYSALASGVVSRQANGVFVDQIAWSELVWNGAPFTLSEADSAMREVLSFDPAYTLTVPDLSKVNPKLIGPITDLLTFYADLQLAGRMEALKKPGDHVFFKHGTPSSWADGQYFVVAEEAVDFDVTLKEIDTPKKTATVLVRHVPPAQSSVNLPAAWMKMPVGEAANNWVEVAKQGEGNFDAEVGMETFDVVLTVSTEDGRLISAHMENPVRVMERRCKDAALTDCADASRYTILRQITIE